jgi:hypothetical protein
VFSSSSKVEFSLDVLFDAFFDFKNSIDRIVEILPASWTFFDEFYLRKGKLGLDLKKVVGFLWRGSCPPW